MKSRSALAFITTSSPPSDGIAQLMSPDTGLFASAHATASGTDGHAGVHIGGAEGLAAA